MKFAIKVLGVFSILLILSGSAYAGIAAPLTHPYSQLELFDYKADSILESVISKFDTRLKDIYDSTDPASNFDDNAKKVAIEMLETVLSVATESEYTAVQVKNIKKAIASEDKNDVRKAVKVLIETRETNKRGGLTEDEYEIYTDAIETVPPNYEALKKLLDLKADLIPSAAVPSTLSTNLGASAATGTAGDGSSTGAGMIGFSIYNQDKNFVDVRFSFGDNAKVTTKGSEFGTFLLNPESGRSFTFSYWTSKFSRLPRPYWGDAKQKRAGESRNKSFVDWSRNKCGGYLSLGFAFADFTDASDVTHSGFLFFPSVGLQFMTNTRVHEAGPNTDKKNKYNLGMQLGLTGRFLGGEFSKYEQKLFRQNASSFGLRRNKTLGFEATLFATVNELRPYLKVIYLDPGSDVTGFSDWQAYLGIDVQTSLFTHELKQ